MPARDLIQEVLSARNWDLSQLAERVAYEERTLRRIRSGEIKLSQKLENLLNQILVESPAHPVMHPTTQPITAPTLKPPVPIRKIPVVGWAQAGEAVDFEDIVEWDDMLTIEISDPKAIAVRVRGDSMSPRIEEGDIVVLACSSRPHSGDTVVARLKDEGVVIKRFQIIDPKQQLYRLISLNEIYAPLERTEDQFVWLYPVDQLIKKMRR